MDLLQQLLLVQVHWQRYLVNFCLILEVFRENNFVNTGSVLGLFLQALLDDHIEIFGDALRDRFVLRCQNFFLELVDVRCVVRVLLCAHFVEYDAERPDIRRLRLVLVLPELRRQVIRRTNFLDFFIILLDALRHRLLSDPLERLASAGLPGAARTDLLDVPKIAQFRRIVLRQENIERLDIPMDHVPGVQVVHAQANMDEDFPEKVVSE